MPLERSERRAFSSSWLESAVFTLDRWIRRRLEVFEFTAHPDCLFRLQVDRTEHGLRLSDGTCAGPGDPILRLHLWNEHIPSMGQQGPTVAWARHVSRAMHTSLRELARYLAQRPDLDDISVICGDMRVGTARQTEQLARIVERYGFEAPRPGAGHPGRMRRSVDAIFILMLVLVTNPTALRRAVLRYFNQRIVLSRATLEERYGASKVPLTVTQHAVVPTDSLLEPISQSLPGIPP